MGGRKIDLIIPVMLLEDGEFSENAGTQIQIDVYCYGGMTLN